MFKPALCASSAAFFALALATASPLCAQTTAEAEPPVALPEAQERTPEVAAPPKAEVDPLLALIRQKLAEPPRGFLDRADRPSLVTFYTDRTAPVWVTKEGLTPAARAAMAEIAKADNWGLNARDFELPQLGAGEPAPASLADAEIRLGLAVLKYARYARGGRLDPRQISRYIDQGPTLLEPKVVLAGIAASDAPDTYLQSLHPKHPQFQLLRQALLKARAGTARPQAGPEPQVRLPDGPQLKPGVDHPHVALLRRRFNAPIVEGGRDTYYDPALQRLVAAFQRENKINGDGVVGRSTRTALNGEPKPALAGSEVERLVLNMERWRWMPETLGQFHVWDNVPEFMTRVQKGGQVIHSAKIIVGKPETQTVMFSANMRYVVFHPEWGVPDSIKVKELLPYLRPSSGGFFNLFGGADTRVLEKHNLKVSFNGRPVDASSVDWNNVDIKRYTCIQPAGTTNVLGVVKFRFPNKHDIYMHDTPQRELFEKQVRTFSHGCIRVHNPGRLAEVLLEEDKGWSNAYVRGLLAQGNNNEVTLDKQIPVHVTYFTAVADEHGTVHHLGDVYGHDNRLAAALAGRPLPLEPPTMGGPEDGQQREAATKAPRKYKQTSNDIFSGLFGN
jgi:L,D-transpeptidase YcbB